MTTPTIDHVREIAMKLPDVIEGTTHGVPSWKTQGKLLACVAIHKSAEPNSLLVKIDSAARKRLLSNEPDTYYLTDHYTDDPVVLVRLASIDRRSLTNLLKQAWQFLHDA